MSPLMLTGDMPESWRRRWKIVRRDSFEDVPGLILSANVENGLCMLRNASGEAKEHDFGPDGFRIVGATR